jgi:alkyl hydroperoxide reductase 1
VSVPGAFTPTCSETHAPGYVAHSKELLQKGADEIVIIAGNDFFVMSAWGKALGAKDEIVSNG